MIGNKTAIFSVLISALVIGKLALADVPSQDAYAYGFPIETQEPDDFYRIELPLVLYESVTDLSLRDLGVYDRAGLPVPRVLQDHPGKPPSPEQRIALNTFALPGNKLPTRDEIRVFLRRAEDETSVELNANNIEASEPTPSLSYIIDTKNLKHSLNELEFEWQATDESFLGKATVTGSDDLINWEPAGKGAVVAMRETDVNIVQRKITLFGKHYDYLRVVFNGVPDNFVLAKTTGIYTGSAPETPRQWLELAPTSKDKDDGFIFHVGGSPLIDRVHIRLPADNVVMRGTLFYWSTKWDHWVQLHRGIYYHLRQANQSIQNTPVTILQRRASRWKLTVETGRKDVDVKLALGWRPDHLVFVAQGEGPYTLVAGRAPDAVEGFPQESMFGDRAILNVLTKNREPAAAYLGQRFEFRGHQALTVQKQIQWQTITLWAVLILGVGLVGWMVFSLARQLRQPQT